MVVQHVHRPLGEGLFGYRREVIPVGVHVTGDMLRIRFRDLHAVAVEHFVADPQPVPRHSDDSFQIDLSRVGWISKRDHIAVS